MPGCCQILYGWLDQADKARGNLSGVYGSPCSSAMSDFATNPNVPDTVWLASWITPVPVSQQCFADKPILHLEYIMELINSACASIPVLTGKPGDQACWAALTAM
jgi:hypothetical protein